MPGCNILSCTSPCCIGQLRYMIVAMGFISVIVTHCHRAVLNIAIVEMVGTTVEDVRPTCPLPHDGASTISNITGGKVDWDNEKQNLNIASFFIGYLIFQIPAGILCDMYGPRHFLIWGILLSSVMTLLIPPCTMYTYWWVIFILRVVTGIGQSGQYPALSCLIGHWIPANERSTVGAIVFASNSIGLIVGNVGTGLIIKYTEDWTLAYYLWGAAGIAFVMVSFCYIYSEPTTDPHLTPMELQYLQTMIDFQKQTNTPYLKIIADKVLYGLIIGQVGHDFIIFTLSNNLPKYLNNVLGLDIETNGLVSFIFLFQTFSSFVFGMLADYLVMNNTNLCLLRKGYTVVSIIFSGVFMLAAGYARCDKAIVITCFAIATFWNGLYYCGLKVHVIDISFNHTGFMMSVVNGFGSVSGFLCSYIVGLVAPNNTHWEWDQVFWIMFGIHIVTSFLYSFLTTCERRPWDYNDDEVIPEKKKPPKWYLETTPSEHEARVMKAQSAKRAHRESASLARAAIKGSRSRTRQ